MNRCPPKQCRNVICRYGPAVPSSCAACEGSHLGPESGERPANNLPTGTSRATERPGSPRCTGASSQRAQERRKLYGDGGFRGPRLSAVCVTEAEREVADLLPLEVSPELARATVQPVPFWFHTFTLNRPTVLTRRVPRAITAIAWRCFRPILPGCACSTSVRLMASTRSSPSAAGPSGWWRSTTSSTGYGSLRGGESDWRAGRAFARSIGCWARKSGICGWTRLRSTVSTSASISFYCCGILHRVENPLRLLRVLHGRTVNGGTVLIETHGLGPDQQDGGAIRVSLPGEVYAGDEFVYWGVRGRRPRAACPDRGVLRGRPVPFRAGCRPPADHRATGRLTAPGWRPHDFFISWSQTRNGVEGGGSQIDRHASGDRRPPPRPRLRPGLIARGARPFTRAARRRP